MDAGRAVSVGFERRQDIGRVSITRRDGLPRCARSPTDSRRYELLAIAWRSGYVRNERMTIRMRPKRTHDDPDASGTNARRSGCVRNERTTIRIRQPR